MTEPAHYDPNRTPVVLWAGKKWPVPPLVADQLDMVWDSIIELTDVLARQESRPLPDEALSGLSDDRKRELALGKALADRVFSLTGAQYRKLREVVFYGLTRAHGDLTQEEFRNTPTTPFEMLVAFWEVRRQSGMYGPARGGDHDPGEAPATDGRSRTSTS